MIDRALEQARERPRHVVLFALVAGMLAAVWAPIAIAPLAAVAALVAGRRGTAGLAVAALLAGGLVADARRDAVDDGRLPAKMNAPVRTSVVLLEPFRERASGERVARARVAEGWARGESVLLLIRPGSRTGGNRIGTGETVRVHGRVVELRDFERLQRRRGALAAITVASLQATGADRGGLAGALDGVRRRAESALDSGLPAESAALLRGMVLGEDDGISRATREAFQASGLSHLLAASGTNVMLLATLVLAAGALTGVPLRARLLLAMALVLLYVPVAGAGPSIQRAGVMGAAGLVAALAGRPAARWYALGLAAAVTLALNPYAAAEPGWQLSFAAVIGLMAWVPGLRLWMRGRRVHPAIGEPAAMTLAATVATAPLLALHFEQVSLASLPANLLAAPAVAPVMWLGTAAGLVGQLGIHTPLSWLAGLFASWVGLVAGIGARLPLATVDTRLGVPAAVGAYVLMAVGPALWRRRGELARLRARAGGRGLAIAAVAATVVLVLGLQLADRGAAVPPPRPGETLVSFLDVGQGDATLVQRDGTAMLVDTGPPDGPVLERLADAGVRRLDALVLTHAQSDHEGAGIAVVRRLRPGLIVNGGAGGRSKVQRLLPAEAAAVGARVVAAARGDVLRLGALEARVLWPPRAPGRVAPAGDPNDLAMVLHVRSGELDLLLTADAESDVTGALPLPQVEVLKVAHHGSDDPGLVDLLRRTKPSLAAIMVGRGNTYGHPTPSTLSALGVVPAVRRTDRDGTVHVRAAGEGLRVQTSGRSAQ